MRYWLVMPAAGAGRRFGSAKQYAVLDKRTVLETSLQLFADDPQCAGGSVVLASEDPHRAELSARLGSRFDVVGGGAQRCHSVCNGLAVLEARAGAQDWVLVHDAARPCLSRADLAQLLECAAGELIGALLAVPVADTLKRDDGGASTSRGVATVQRESLWLAQTPQMFRYAPLRDALEQAIAAGRVPTDEAQAMEWQGFSARLVQARDSNLKVTNASDLALAEAVLAARRARECG